MAQATMPREPAVEISSRDTGLSFGFLYGASCYLTRLLMTGCFDLRVYNVDRVPASGPAILAPNHVSTLDPIAVGTTLRRRIAYLARSSLFEIPVFGSFIARLGALPVPRESQAPREALELCLRVLDRGRLLLLFPEGTRSADGRIGELKKGTAWIARRSGAPVIPVRVLGTYESWPRREGGVQTGILPRRFPIRVIYGNPLEYRTGESSDTFLARLRSTLESLGLEEFGHERRGPSWYWNAVQATPGAGCAVAERTSGSSSRPIHRREGEEPA